MKTILASLSAVVFLVGSASAQQKLWTWKPGKASDAHFMHASAMAKDGSGAFVIGRSGAKGETSYLLAWIAADGRVLMSRRIGTSDAFVDVAAVKGTRWQVCFMPGNRVAFNDQETVRIYELQNGKVGSPKVMQHRGAILFGRQSGFAGWIEREGRTIYFGEDLIGTEAVSWDQITAWKL